jgi:hypothetical protein
MKCPKCGTTLHVDVSVETYMTYTWDRNGELVCVGVDPPDCASAVGVKCPRDCGWGDYDHNDDEKDKIKEYLNTDPTRPEWPGLKRQETGHKGGVVNE